MEASDAWGGVRKPHPVGFGESGCIATAGVPCQA